jgi:uncharacterized protein
MPRLEETGPAEGVRTVRGYAKGGFRIAGEQIAGAAWVTPDATGPWPVGALAALSVDDFAQLLTLDGIEVVLLGTGPTMLRPPKDLAPALKAKGVAFDFMDSKAAARTYNILALEGRRVAAALLPL